VVDCDWYKKEEDVVIFRQMAPLYLAQLMKLKKLRSEESVQKL